jgi:hypothetical protein
MFLSYQFVGSPGVLDFLRDHMRWSYTIIDDEFQAYDTIETSLYSAANGVEVVAAVINTYGKRNLPVVYNIIKAIQWWDVPTGPVPRPFNYVIKANKQHNPLYKPYAEEVDRLLLLL